MRHSSPGTRRALAALVLGFIAATSSPGATPAGELWRDWHVLELRARSSLLRGEVELRIKEEGAERQLETRTTARFLGAPIARSRTVSTLDRATGRPKELVTYSRKRARRFRFHERSYSVEKLAPPASADGTPDEKEWEVRSRAEFPYPSAKGEACAVVFDYYGMLLHLREVNLERSGDEVTLYVATADGPRAYRILVTERRSSRRTYTDLASGKKVTVPTSEARLRISPVDPKQADEGFLAMEGETELWVEAGSGTLLELSGKAPKVGRVRLTLSALG